MITTYHTNWSAEETDFLRNNYKHYFIDVKMLVAYLNRSVPSIRSKASKLGLTKYSPMLGKHHSEESKEKMRLSHIGKQGYWLGKHLSKEHVETIKKSNTGRSRSEKTKEKNRLSNLGKKHSEEWREHNSLAHLGKPSPMRGKHYPELSGENASNWRGGTSFLPYCHKFNNELKERIRERDNRTCQLCAIKENGKKLDVHHIHYDKENCDPDLIALCHCCHAKVNSSNRIYWEKYFVEHLITRELIK